MKVAILGCGPSGLVAAEAAVWAGADEVVIYSKARKSDMFGAQYLHEPIPGVPYSPSIKLHYILHGTMDEYRRKVYGDDWDGQVSPAEFQGDHQAWDIREMYDCLWERYKFDIIQRDITSNWIRANEQLADFTFSTIPLNRLCDRGHTFAGQEIWAAGETKPLLPYKDTIICNGYSEPAWYRLSNVFGYQTCEWPERSKPPIPVAKVIKPLWTNCTCFPNLIRIGRYGRWQKGLLVHHGFDEIDAIMNGSLSPIELRPHQLPCPMADDKLSSDVRIQMGCHCD